jgi:transcriptional regulator with XRE-family HTH domain
MDQIKIGKFIAECRKAQELTQAQLAERLNVTDKAVSKWETGRSIPDAAIMLALCDVLGITVNELLSGERLDTDRNDPKNEQLLLDMAKVVAQKEKIIWSAMWVIMGVSMIAMFAGIFLAAFLIPEGVWQLVTVIGICIVFLLPCFYALRLEVSVGVYKCKKCGCEVTPTYSEALWAMHKGTTRHLKCPQCKQRTWCKKVLK